jgi:hypothetical protein
MQTLTTYSQQVFAKAHLAALNTVDKVRDFHNEEKSAKGASEEGVLTYIGIALVVVVGAIVIANSKTIFTSIMDTFKTGTSKAPTGWQ